MFPSPMRETFNPNTMNYDQKITLEQALDLQNRYPELLIYSGSGIPFEIRDFYCTTHYDLGECIYLTRSDFATFILGNKPVPEGYGYPSKELPNDIYNGLEYATIGSHNNYEWVFAKTYRTEATTLEGANYGEWYEYAFKLTDLARVEALADPKPSMPAHFTYQNDEWLREANKLAVEHEELKAKYSEQASEIAKYLEMGTENASLKLQLLEATAFADSKQARINELEAEVKGLKAKNNKASNYIDKLERFASISQELEQAKFNLSMARSEFYSRTA